MSQSIATGSRMIRVRRELTPTRVHVVSLVLGMLALLGLGSQQWFTYDDWALLHPSLDWWASHQGHWTTAPTLLFQGLRATVGLHSYLPYLALALIAHLAVVHLVWRLSLRAGVAPWWATGFATATIVLGCAAENIFWAFQVGFMGAVALALVVVLLLDRTTLTLPAAVVAGAVAVLSLPFSGTALPVLVGAGLLGWIRRGPLRTAAVLAPAVVIYAVWYLLEARGQSNGLGVEGIQFVTKAPLFLGVMFGAWYGEFTGLVVLGPLVALGLLIWVIRARRRWLGREAAAYVLLVASVVFAVLTAVSRGGGELTAAGAQRYVYVIVMLAVPTMGLAVSAVARRGGVLRVVAIVAVLAVAGVNVALGAIRAQDRAVIEQTTQREFSAAASLIRDDPTAYPDSAIPIRGVAPDLTMGDIRSALDAGLVTLVTFTPDDLRAVEDSLAGR